MSRGTNLRARRCNASCRPAAAGSTNRGLMERQALSGPHGVRVLRLGINLSSYTKINSQKVKMSKVKLNLTPLQFIAIYELLYNTQLGDRNEYEAAISDLMIQMEKDGAQELINGFLVREGYDAPSIGAKFSNEDGLVISLE